uniref:TM2 domain-containing protein 3 n=1 Tax=Ailuropoda melanoleuca TaxID=9646 RepID=A0A7N5JVX3_AILME
PFPVANHGRRTGRLVGGELWGTRIPHSAAAELPEGQPAPPRRTHAEPAARLRPGLPGDAPVHAPTARTDSPPLCLAPPRGPEVHAPARWRLRRYFCGPCAACAGCCCSSPSSISCRAGDQDFKSQKNFIMNMTCRFCWQLPESDYECSNSTSCMTVSCPRQRYTANCTVRDHVHCLGNRTFPKMLYCNWTGGYKWSTALALSITLGGFGADRFYLGQWREGLGKLFSFGGLGIWTLIDVLLIGVGYVGPADGSLYI